MKIRNWFVGLILLLAPAGIAFAQTATSESEIDLGNSSQVAAPANTVSCFDYYTFGSVQANLTAPVTGTVSGTPITFSGTLINKNPYPVVDGALYVKVFKSRGSSNDGNGPDVVDQFLVKGDIVIPANGSVPVSFSWKVPSYAASGDYSIATFFTTSRKFNLLGLSFTDDVVGNTVPFKVIGEQTTGIKFDKSAVTIDGQSYHFAAFPPHADAAKPVVVSAKVKNTSSLAETASVSWTVYQWDAQLRENVVQEESAKPVNVPANSSATVSITVSDTKYPVYLVVGTLQWKDTKSVIGARFVRDGVDRTRINFPGIMSFPLKAGAENTLFSCLHNSGTSDVVSGGSLDLTLSDKDGNVIKEYKYTGDITGAMMGVAEKFTPTKSYDYFTLNARLYQGDKFVDEANLTYDCNQIDPTLCMADAGSVGMPDFLNVLGSAANVVLGVFALIVLVFLLWIYRKLTRRPTSGNTSQLPPM